MFNTRYYDPGTGSEGGGGTPPADEAEVKEFESLSSKAEHTAEEKVRLEELKGKYDQVVLGEDGKPLSAEQIAAVKEIETKVNAILAKDEDKRTPEELKYLTDNTLPDEDQKSVYQQVDELRGAPIEVEYGDVDPNSPQGILLREETIADLAKQELEDHIQAKFGRAYQFMLHLKNGGKEADFFAPQNQNFLSIKLDKDNKVEQERILRTALELKGNSPDIIDIAVTNIKDNAKLLEHAQKELEALQQNQTQREEQVRQQLAQRKQKTEQDVNVFNDTLIKTVDKGFDGIVVPAADKKKFLDFFATKVDYNQNDGTFMYQKRIDVAQLAKELKVAYFEFKGGDLKGLVERTAKTQQALRIKGAGKTAIVPKGTGPAKAYTPISQLTK